MTLHYPWNPDRGDGTYRNPVIASDYSDPDVIRHGDDFFMTASSFHCTPGLPILHSRDLVNWTLVNHALVNLPNPRFSRVQPGQGVWAPSLRVHAGRFWIFFAMPDEGLFVVTAEHPTARWSTPHLLAPGEGLIDPCPLWDDDGNAYLVHAYAASRAGIKHRLRVRPMAPDGSRLLGQGQIVFFDPNKHPTIEGPKFLKRGGWYYILAPAGGVPRGWQVALRARSVYGPYEDRIVLEQGETDVNGPHQGALVDTADGAWWFIHFQDAGYLGRIAHLQPVTWREDWPQMGADRDGNGVGEPVASFRMPVPTTPTTMVATAPQTSDEFDGPRLGRQWQWNANHEAHWSDLVARPGWLRLLAQPAGAGDAPDLGLAPNLLLQKFPAAAFSVETLLDVSGVHQGHRAGLVVIGREHATLAVRRDPDRLRLALSINNQTVFVTDAVSSPVRLRADVAAGGACSFSYAPANGGPFWPVSTPFRAQPGDWIGARAGLYCIATEPTVRGYADFGHFRFGPLGDSER